MYIVSCENGGCMLVAMFGYFGYSVNWMYTGFGI